MEYIIKLLNEWDPIDLLPFAPNDEYYFEATEIYDYINSDSLISVDDLARKINDIFIHSFDEDVYIEDITSCRRISQKFSIISVDTSIVKAIKSSDMTLGDCFIKYL